MPSTEFERDGSFVTEKVQTDTQTAEIRGHIPARHLRLSLADGQVANDGQDTETLTVSVVSGLEIARGTDPSNATVLDHDGTATVEIDGQPVDVSLTNGTGQREITTTKPAGTTISVEAVGLTDHPAERDSNEIEVLSA